MWQALENGNYLPPQVFNCPFSVLICVFSSKNIHWFLYFLTRVCPEVHF